MIVWLFFIVSCRKVDWFKSFISLSWMNSIILKRPCIFSWMKSLLVLTDLEWPDEIVYIISFICIDWINLLIQGEIWLNKSLKICESLTLFFVSWTACIWRLLSFIPICSLTLLTTIFGLTFLAYPFTFT